MGHLEFYPETVYLPLNSALAPPSSCLLLGFVLFSHEVLFIHEIL